MSQSFKITTFAVLSLLLCSCKVGSHYRRPVASVPTTYKEQTPEQFKEVDGWKPGHPLDAMSRGVWWEMFSDPQLNRLEGLVIVNNQNIKASLAAYEQARALVRYNRTALFPTLTTTPSINRSYSGTRGITRVGAGGTTTGGTGSGSTGVSSTGATTLYSLPFDASYQPDLWGRVRRTIEGSSDTAQASFADLENVRLTMQSELAIAYFQLRNDDAVRQLLERTVSAYETALQLTINRFNGGVASQVDVTQAQAQLEAAQSQLIDIGVARAQSEHAIATLTGQPPANLSLPQTPLIGTPPIIPPGLPSELLERRPDIAAAERRVAASNAQIGVAKSAYYPNLTLSASAGLQSTSFTSWFTWPSRFWSVGPSLAETLFDAGARRALTAEAVSAYDQTAATYRESVLAAFQEVEDYLSTLRILASEYVQQTEAVRTAEHSLALSLDRYKGGITTYLEVLTAQTTAFSAEQNLVNLLGRRMVAAVQLVEAIGGGWDTSRLPTAAEVLSTSSTPALNLASAVASPAPVPQK